MAPFAASPHLIEGTDGTDYLFGETGIDLIIGYGGDDHVFYDNQAEMQGDTVAGGAGFDTLSISFASTKTGITFQVVDSANLVTLLGAKVIGVETYAITAGAYADRFTGGTWDDRFVGGAGNDTALGGLGNDTLFGETGHDRLEGGNGDDALLGDTGNDLLTGGNGRDQLYGGSGNDRLYGQAGEDQMYGEVGNDLMDGGTGNDTMRGGDGNDTMFGQAGDDSLSGGAGADSMNGGSGNDVIERWHGEGADSIDGGTGLDRLVMHGLSGNFVAKAATVVNLLADGTRIIGIEAYSIDGTEQANLFAGESGDDVLNGFHGADTLRGGGGQDLLMGGEGRDLLEGGDGDDILIVGAGGIDTIRGGAGTDTARIDRFTYSDAIDYRFTGAATATLSDGTTLTDIEIVEINTAYGDDVLAAGTAQRVVFNAAGGNNSLTGSAGDDVLASGYGNDTINAGNGIDRIIDGGGNNFIDSGAGDDEVSVDGATGWSRIKLGTGNDVVYINNGGGSAGGAYTVDGGSGIDYAWINRSGSSRDLTFTLSAQAPLSNGSVTLTNIERVHIRSGSGRDSLVGGALDDWFNGMSGDDTLLGLGGNDELTGWYGADRLEGGDGADILWATGGIKDGEADTLLGGAGADELHMNRGDFADGGADADRLFLDLTEEYVNFAFVFSTGLTQVDATTRFTGMEQLHFDGGRGHDSVTGGSLADLLEGNAGNDRLRGGSGNDELTDGDGNDSLYGDAGNDVFVRTDFDANGTDYFDGSTGVDTLRFNIVSGAPVWLDMVAQQYNGGLAQGLTLRVIENVVGSDAGDDIRGSASANTFWGGKGTDYLEGREGDDLLIGGEGSDLLSGGAGRDIFRFGLGATGSGDFILDFVRGEDRIAIEREAFGLGNLATPSLVVGASPVVNAATAQFLFETGTGRLWFDADGTGDQADVSWVATLDGVTTLSTADLILV
ncbi:calcium-binding protein [Falsiroseomonas selenitidurans]|uniref:Calcium-binding protein n=1 Tax=Falsiroseomonas selenitidurans TaxID=2716335 RepID=A0ABX1E3I0_9PROT|nr:calcium-binding protein [Falsiroseomonas selenitidurans]NKC30327.1 calcium-binding protein [Falsiroseomonas selenitidurans]